MGFWGLAMNDIALQKKPVKPAALCNICGGREFKDGPAGRQWNGLRPACIQCGALERHRVYRLIFEGLDTRQFSDLVALQFSRDPSIERSWFRTLDHSVYGATNSLDIQRIALQDGAYDVVVCNHVLEHVEDDIASINELVRISSDRGFLFLSVPNPAEREHTIDWGFPDNKQHGHYRIYGIDIVEKIAGAARNWFCVMVKHKDPVTGRDDLAFLLSKTRKWHDLPIQKGMRAQSVCVPRGPV
jgi:SAM-dependent methyltransferase